MRTGFDLPATWCRVVLLVSLLVHPTFLALAEGPAASDRDVGADRAAAEWILSHGGRVKIQIDGKKLLVKRPADLPEGAIRVIEIDLAGTGVTDADLARPVALPAVRRFDLSGTEISDDGLAPLAALTGLRHLFLRNTRVAGPGLAYLAAPDLRTIALSGSGSFGDAGLAYLVGHRRLATVAVAGTAVSDAGMEHLARLENLRALRIGRTAVTEQGLAVIRDARPECRIFSDRPAKPREGAAVAGRKRSRPGQDKTGNRAAPAPPKDAGEAPDSAPAAAGASLGRIFELQLGLFHYLENARNLVEDSGHLDPRPYIVEVESSKGETRYTVRVGPYPSLDEATRAAARLADDGLPTVVRFRTAP